MNTVEIRCFWCNNPTGKYAVARVPDGVTCAYLDYELCRKCQEDIANGRVMVAEYVSYPVYEGQPSLNGVFPTGRRLLVARDRLAEVVTDPEVGTHQKFLADTNQFSLIAELTVCS